jgi:hypothetical protein
LCSNIQNGYWAGRYHRMIVGHENPTSEKQIMKILSRKEEFESFDIKRLDCLI